jgi:hypothetical protein
MNHKKFWQGWEQITFGILGAGAFYCLMVTAISYWKMDGLDKRSVEEGVIVRGMLEYSPKGRFIPDIGIRESGGRQWRCSVIFCSYDGLGQDYGKVAEAIILEGQIVQIKIDNVVKLEKRMWESAHIKRHFANTGFLLCIAIALIRFRRKRAD